MNLKTRTVKEPENCPIPSFYLLNYQFLPFLPTSLSNLASELC